MLDAKPSLSNGNCSFAKQSPFTGSSQTVSPFAGGNPYLQAAGAIGGLATGLGSLIG